MKAQVTYIPNHQKRFIYNNTPISYQQFFTDPVLVVIQPESFGGYVNPYFTVLNPYLYFNGLQNSKKLIAEYNLEKSVSQYDYAVDVYQQMAQNIQIENLMENLIYSLVHDPGTEDEINRSLMELLFLYLAKYAKTLGEDSSSRFEDVLVMAARRYIDRTYQTATLGELAATLHETDSFVSRLIKAKTGKTFKELLQEKRLKAACALLRQTDLPVSDIAAAVGYENSSFFHRLFRERVGYSPADYRRRQKSAPESV